MPGSVLVDMRNITKSFGAVPALRGASLVVRAGEVHALLGENGAGKSTLMHVLSGLVRPDGGEVLIDGRPADGTARGAMAAGVGMVHQHFTLVPTMTVAENVWLGRSGRYAPATAAALVRRTGERAGLPLDPGATAGSLPIGLQQRLEILKALARDARILILDEPGGALTPAEIEGLFAALRTLRARGLAIILITHKLRDVAAIADCVTVLRRGSVVSGGPAADFTPAALAQAMVGESEAALALERAAAPPVSPPRDHAVLAVENLAIPDGSRTVVAGVSLEVRAHEIVGIAAVEGNGQRELLRAVAGLLPAEGRVTISGDGRSGFVPEDRQQDGLVLDFSLAENFALGEEQGFLLSRGYLEDRAAVATDEFGITTSGADQPVRTLSGGNQQKVVLARVLGRRPALLVAENPTRGLDVRATADVHAALRRAAGERGMGVLFYSTDLDEVLALSDRIGIMLRGQWTWASDADRTRERLGALMLGAAA